MGDVLTNSIHLFVLLLDSVTLLLLLLLLLLSSSSCFLVCFSKSNGFGVGLLEILMTC